MTTPTTNRMPYAEQKQRGEAIYNTQIRPRISPEDAAKFVLVDVLSGDYEVDDRSARARMRLRARRPEAVIHKMRNHRTYVGRARSPRRITGQHRHPNSGG